MSHPHATLAELFKAEYGRLLGRLLRQFGFAAFAAAEDAVQQAMLQALRHWPLQGLPQQPLAWLHTTAQRVMLDQLRAAPRHQALPETLNEVIEARDAACSGERFGRELVDEELILLLAVCDPALPLGSQVPLALHCLGGLGLRELAAGMLIPEATLAQRLKRARDSLAARAQRFELPGPEQLPQRMTAVLAALYLMFNEGYHSADGQHYSRREWCFEAIRLVRALAAHPTAAAPEVDALAALMCLHAARLSGRLDADGQALLLPEQSRDRWDQGLIAMGFRHLDRAGRGTRLSRYHLEAAIAAAHASAKDYAATDWAAILRWYEALIALDAQAVPRLAHAIALGEVHGPAAGLAAVEQVLPQLPQTRYPFGHCARAHFLRRLQRPAEAIEAYRKALSATRSEAEARLIERQIAATAAQACDAAATTKVETRA